MLRFRLRTFLIAITAFCLLLGWRVAAVESVERPIRELERLGWELENRRTSSIYIAGHGSWRIHPSPPRDYLLKLLIGIEESELPDYAVLSDQGLPSGGPTRFDQFEQAARWLNHLPSIECMDISCADMDATCLTPIADIRHLRRLAIYSESIDDGALSRLATLQHLTFLSVWKTKISREGALMLQSLLPNCEFSVDFWQVLQTFEPLQSEEPESLSD